MPSSISNSDLPFVRPLPEGRWHSLAVTVAVAVLLIIGIWEITCRAAGYMPTLNDNPYLWAMVRGKVNKTDAADIVIIGSSRALFDLRLDVLKELNGREPLQLSIVGSTPLLILEDIAANTKFNGTVIAGVTPVLFFAPGGPPMDKPTEWLQFYREISPSQRISQWIGIFLQQRLAFIQQEDLTLPALLDLIPVTDRPNAHVPPKLPPFLNTLEINRQAALIDKLVKEPAYAQRVKNIWQGLFAVPAADDAAAGYIIGRYVQAVETIRARGGRVVFIRPPATGWLLDKENELTPKHRFWDKLLAQTQSVGLDFKDYPEQAALDCPEWSHITREDAYLYTKSLVQLLRDVL